MYLKSTNGYNLVDNERVSNQGYNFANIIESDSTVDLASFLSNPSTIALAKYRITSYDKKLYTYKPGEFVAALDIFEIVGIDKQFISNLMIVGKLRDPSRKEYLGFFDLKIGGTPFASMNSFNIENVYSLVGEIQIAAINVPAGMEFDLYVLVTSRR